MKSIILSTLAAGILVGTTSGRPLGSSANVNKQRNILTHTVNKRALVTEVVYVTATVDYVVVYVDENGAPYSTTTEAKITSTSSAVVTMPSATVQTTTEPAVTSAASSSSIDAALSPTPSSSALRSFIFSAAAVGATSEYTSVQVKQSSSLAAASAPPSSTSATKPSTTPPPPAPSSVQPPPPPPVSSSTASEVPTKDSSGDSLGLGVTYDPFAGTGESATCKTPDQIAQDFSQMKDYAVVRIYGMGCDQIANAVKNAIKNGQKLMSGAYLTSSGGEDLGQVIETLKSAVDQYAGGSWDVIALFSVENEQLNDRQMTASAVIDAINRARSQLRGLGYNGPVGAVETVPATIDNPAICEASDVVMVNCHAFFDSNTAAKDAGSFVKSQVAMVKNACNNKRVIVTESGWPHQGNSHNMAVASPDNQRIALDSIRSNFKNDMFLFNAFDDPWKANTASTFNAEQYWGIM
jgi:exo-beta-1,3-glucanase (GH17 family)